MSQIFFAHACKISKVTAVHVTQKISLGYFITIIGLAVSAFFLEGCANSVMTNPPRSATEQLLLSTAADRAINSTTLTMFDGKKVYLDGSYFESYDSKYVLGAIRDALSRAGARLTPSSTNSEIIVEARSGALSTDSSDSLFGIPQTGIPIPLSGALQIPELAFYKSSRQKSYAKLFLLAYSNESREHIYSSGTMFGTSYNTYYKLLGLIQWTATDLPEKHRKN